VSVLEPNTATIGRSVGGRKRGSGITPALDRERLAARARTFRVRVLELEAGVHQRLAVIERRPGEEELALDVELDAEAVKLENVVALARVLLEVENVGQPRATPPHADTQAVVGLPVLDEQFLRLRQLGA
jgi:hypothetical protein